MNKREFLKTAGLAGLALSQQPLSLLDISGAAKKEIDVKWKHRAWVTPSKDETQNDIRSRYENYANAGITVVYIEEDNEMHFRLAKANGIEAHRWIKTFLKDEDNLMKAHPEWYSVNRKGASCIDKPAYVPYYHWLCPSRQEVHDYLESEAKEILSKEYVDGYHLDYVRYCDVILPVNLWSKYGIVQTSELPEYDYCYCDVCRSACKVNHGFDPMDLEYPDQSLTWRKYRYDRITALVNRIYLVAHQYQKPLTAAVFPTPEVAHRLVRQDWTNWNLDAINPMIYHGFYREGVSWIGDAVAEGVHGLHDKFPLFAGVYLPDFKNDDELKQGILNALKNGAAGVTIFNNPDKKVLDVLVQATAEASKG